MATYTLETPRGRRLTIESDSPENAMRLADQWDLEDHAATEAKRLGVNPDLILRQMQKESGGNPRAVSPKGARGPMQLMPGTAKDLGVNPDDPYDNITGGVTYFRQMMDRYGGDERKALAAYNAGPGAVDKYGGVPPYAETQDYVQTLAGGSPAAAPQLVPSVPRPQRQAPQAPAPVKSQPLGLAEGMTAPWERLRDRVPGLNDALNNPLLLGSPLGIGNRMLNFTRDKIREKEAEGYTPGKIGEFGGNVLATLPLAPVPGGPLVQGGLGGALLSEAKTPGGLAADVAIGAASGKLTDMALSGAGKAIKRVVSPAVPKPGQVEAAKEAAYQTVQNMGVKYKKAPFSGLLQSLDDQARAADYSPLLHQRITGVLQKAGTLKGKAPTFTEVEQLRRFIQRNTIADKAATDEERRIGRLLLGQVDDFIQTMGPKQVIAGDPKAAAEAIAVARDLARRDFVIKDVQGALETAISRTQKSGTGGNFDNVLRQELDKVLKTSKGLKPAERAALEQAVRGGTARNMLRQLGRLSPTTGGLSAMLHTGAAGISQGATLPIAAGGYLAKTIADNLTKGAAKDVIRTVAQPLAKAPTAQQALMLNLLNAGLRAVRPAAVGGAAALGTGAAAYARTPTVQQQQKKKSGR